MPIGCEGEERPQLGTEVPAFVGAATASADTDSGSGALLRRRTRLLGRTSAKEQEAGPGWVLGSDPCGRAAVPIVPARLGATPNNSGRDMDSIDEILGELPLPPYATAEDVRFAVNAVTLHAAEQWPDGPRCRNDRAPHPCRLHPWGRRVLDQLGLTDRQIRALIAEQEASQR